MTASFPEGLREGAEDASPGWAALLVYESNRQVNRESNQHPDGQFSLNLHLGFLVTSESLTVHTSRSWRSCLLERAGHGDSWLVLSSHF